MARTLPQETSRRRRARLAELLSALGAQRGAKVTQREFAQSIGREQGTIAAILGGHRALGGDVMLAIVRTYGLPVDYFDSPLGPDARIAVRAAISVAVAAITAPRAAKSSPATPRHDDPALASAVDSLKPDRAVAMALEQLFARGVRLEADGWIRQGIAAQSAHERGVLLEWFDESVSRLAKPEPPRAQPTIVKVSEMTPRASRA